MNLASRDYSEKRNFMRMMIDAPASLTLTEDQSTVRGSCHDLSANGMQVALDKALPVGTEAIITIQSPKGDRPIMKARVTVARIISNPDEPCLAGMEIEEICD
jgi:hypothetical protein